MTRAEVFREWFSISPKAAILVDALYGAEGEPLTRAELRAVAGLSDHGLYGAIKRIKQAMDRGSIRVRLNLGYQLTKVGLGDCDKALADAAVRMAA